MFKNAGKMPDARGWDGRDYKLSSAVRQLPSFGLLSGDDRMISRKAVLQLLEKHAAERRAEQIGRQG